jgi:glycerol uptake facilitator-like aquaporin
MPVNTTIFARVMTAFTAAFVLSGFAINNARALGPRLGIVGSDSNSNL